MNIIYICLELFHKILILCVLGEVNESEISIEVWEAVNEIKVGKVTGLDG